MPVIPYSNPDDGQVRSTSLSNVPKRLIRDIDEIGRTQRFSRNEVVTFFLRWALIDESVDLAAAELDSGPTENGITIRVGKRLLEAAAAKVRGGWERNDVLVRALTLARNSCLQELGHR